MKLSKSVILLVNLGSPNSLDTHAIRRFLRKFLSDRRVVNLPKLLWYPILFGIILPIRAPKLLYKYQQIWLNSVSPVIYYTRELAIKMSQLIKDDTIVIRHAFSYVSPSIDDVLNELHAKFNIVNLKVIPLYPQFSSTTTLPVFDNIHRYYADKYFLPSIIFINEFHANELYINAIVASIKESWAINGRGDKLIFSYHSLPQDIIKRGDVYYMQCLKTTQLVVDILKLNINDYVIGFQSKFGLQKWLSPSTTSVLIEVATNGVKQIDIVCPSFICDCLETLEEVAIVNKQLFINAGGKVYNYIKCLNDRDDFILALASLT